MKPSSLSDIADDVVASFTFVITGEGLQVKEGDKLIPAKKSSSIKTACRLGYEGVKKSDVNRVLQLVTNKVREGASYEW